MESKNKVSQFQPWVYLSQINKDLIPYWICDEANFEKFDFSVLNKILPDEEKEEARAYKNI